MDVVLIAVEESRLGFRPTQRAADESASCAATRISHGDVKRCQWKPGVDGGLKRGLRRLVLTVLIRDIVPFDGGIHCCGCTGQYQIREYEDSWSNGKLGFSTLGLVNCWKMVR